MIVMSYGITETDAGRNHSSPNAMCTEHHVKSCHGGAKYPSNVSGVFERDLGWLKKLR
jgi:hypothetical protein